MNGISSQNSLRAIAFVIGCLLIAAPAANADEISQGKKLYIEHCAACHGIKADGHGPLEHELAVRATDLRYLAKKYGNPLPYDQIARFMDGRAEVKAHGPRDMPVWGEEMWRYPEGKGPANQVSEPVARIIRYLQSIQIGSAHALLKESPSEQWNIGQ
jgi:mono/diheme cytochrome c family protein